MEVCPGDSNQILGTLRLISDGVLTDVLLSELEKKMKTHPFIGRQLSGPCWAEAGILSIM